MSEYKEWVNRLKGFESELEESREKSWLISSKKMECECGQWHAYPQLRYKKSKMHDDYCVLYDKDS